MRGVAVGLFHWRWLGAGIAVAVVTVVVLMGGGGGWGNIPLTITSAVSSLPSIGKGEAKCFC